MGLLSLASGAIARSVNIAGLQSVSTDLVWRVRIKVDGLKLGASSFSYGIGQVDDGTDANRKFALSLDAGASGAFGFTSNVPGGGGISTPSYVPSSYAALANGRFIVALFWLRHSVFDHGFAIYDDTGTGTLVDGLAPGTSVFQSASAYNNLFPVITGNGEVAVNYSFAGASLAQIFDSIHLLNALPTADAVPTSGQIIAGYLFDDAPGASTFVSDKAGGPVLTPSGTYTLVGGGAESPTTFVPTTVTGTPSSPSCAVGGTVQLVPVTQDQFGSTGTLTPATRTYSYTVTSGGSFGSVNSSGLVSGTAIGTIQVTVADTATGGGSAAHWVVNVAVTGATGTTYDCVSSNTGVFQTTTGVAGTPGATLTDEGSGSATLTVTRHGTSLSCTVSVACAGPGIGNEPSGMTPGINTGSITTAPNPVGNGTWKEGTIIQSTFTNFTPTGQTAAGIDPSFIALAPDGPGMETKYVPALHGGTNGASFGCSIAQPSGTLAGELYLKLWVRWRLFSNQSVLRSDGTTLGPLTVGTKICEPRCGQSTENHVLAHSSTSATDGFLNLLTQGCPTANNHPRLDVGPPFPSLATQEPNGDLLQAAQAWQEIESIWGQESVPGVSGDGFLKAWVAGALAFDSTITGTWSVTGPINLLNSSSSKGWQFLQFNQTYGGLADQYGPPSTMFLGVDRIYASSK